MIVVSSEQDLRAAVSSARQSGHRIGCVPTMGALHAGHQSLLEASVDRCDFTVATIFVNPTQFAPTEDLEQYPRPLEADLELCRRVGVDCVFTPDVSTMYPEGFATWVTVERLTRLWEGASRPDHFRGVTTIVLKLFNLVQPDVAFFGAKDFQQQAVIRKMVRDLNLPVEIDVCPTVREPDGLALSSRNAYLSDDERRSALGLHRTLEQVASAIADGERDLNALVRRLTDELAADPLVEPDYLAIVDPDSLEPLESPQAEMVALIAARVGKTRLIDNRPLA